MKMKRTLNPCAQNLRFLIEIKCERIQVSIFIWSSLKTCRILNEQLMRLIDEQYIQTPFYGIDKMTECLRRIGHHVNHKRVRRLMRQMGLEAVYPRRRRGLSIPDKEHKIYPYLLRDVQITRPDQVWSADITYIRMYRGWLYLVAVIDWFRRYVLSWEVSVTLESDFCVSALGQALSLCTPHIFNTDQSSQFTSIDFTKVLLNIGVQISMDGKGRVFDNIFSERLWRTVKVEEVYLRDYQTVAEATYSLGRYIDRPIFGDFYLVKYLLQGVVMPSIIVMSGKNKGDYYPTDNCHR
jgi:putative transposase